MKADNNKKENNYNDPLTEKIIGGCYEIYNKIGPGFSEKVYSKGLKNILDKTGIRYEAEKQLDVVFEGTNIGKFRVDLLVESKVIVELKSIDGIMPKSFEKQLISYLKASDIKVGLLINFGYKKCQVRRLINK